VYKEYVDHVSGSTERCATRGMSRDQAYRELMDDVAKRRVDCVIVWKYDRFARSLNVLITALQQFHALGVDFISYTQAIDTTTPMGRLFYHIIGSFAEFEREMIVERVRAGLANARAKGKTLGRPERDRSARARIRALRQQGLSLREIARREKRSPAGVLKILRRVGAPDNPMK
jgi:DNA invertase Pin-like site-specific DNA recombinase